jgi:hypothetical protein
MANRVLGGMWNGWMKDVDIFEDEKEFTQKENFDQITSPFLLSLFFSLHPFSNISIAIKLAKRKIGFFGYQNRTQ